MTYARHFGAMQPGQAVVYLRREHVRGWPWPRSWSVAAYDVPPDVATRPPRRPVLVNAEPRPVEILARMRWNEQDADKPTKGCRVVRLGNFNWRAVWCDDLKG